MTGRPNNPEGMPSVRITPITKGIPNSHKVGTCVALRSNFALFWMTAEMQALSGVEAPIPHLNAKFYLKLALYKRLKYIKFGLVKKDKLWISA